MAAVPTKMARVDLIEKELGLEESTELRHGGVCEMNNWLKTTDNAKLLRQDAV